MAFLLNYLWAEYRKRLYLTLRQIIFLSIVIALMFFFAAMFPALNYEFTATFQFAQYDIMINGPLTKPDVEAILNKLKPWHPTYVGLNGASVDKLLVNGRSYQGAENFYFDPRDYKKISLTYFSKDLLLKGGMKRPDAWGIDYMTAKHVGAGIGDQIEFEQALGDSYGNIRRVRRSGIIRAIYAPTNEVKGLIVPLSPEVARLLRADGVLYSFVFIRTERGVPDELAAQIASIPQAKEWLIEPVPRAYAQGKARVEQTFNRNVRYATVWAALFIYAIYILREQFNRMERRKKNLAILFSLGLPESRIYQLFICEQLILNLSTAFIGIWLGKYLLEDNLGMYVPRETYFSLGGLFSLIILVVLGLTLIQLVYRLRRLDVAKLLTME